MKKVIFLIVCAMLASVAYFERGIAQSPGQRANGVEFVAADPTGTCNAARGERKYSTASGCTFMCNAATNQWVAQGPCLFGGSYISGGGNNPSPTLSSISPTSTTAGGNTFTLTVNGTNFIGSSVVRWNGSNRTTTYLSATQLTASIPSTDITAAGTATVTVFNPTPGGGTSSGQTFTINAAPPSNTYYVSPSGSGTTCSLGSPCTLQQALTYTSTITAGATIEMRSGTYSAGGSLLGSETPKFNTTLVGSSGSPITIRPYQSEVVNIQGGIQFDSASQWLVLDGKELQLIIDNPSPFSTSTRTTGVNVFGDDITIKNVVFVRNGNAVATWVAGVRTTVTGCIMYRNGWQGDTRGFGHGLYIQNDVANGRKTFENLISMDNAATGGKVYAESGQASGATINDSTFANNGSIANQFGPTRIENFDLGGTISIPGNDNVFDRNVCFHPQSANGLNFYSGYLYTTGSMNNAIRDNYFASGTQSSVLLKYQKNLTFTGNKIVSNDRPIEFLPPTGFTNVTSLHTVNNNQYWSNNGSLAGLWIVDDGQPRALNTTPFGIPSWQTSTSYDLASTETNPGTSQITWVRPLTGTNGKIAFVTIISWGAQSTASVDLSSFVTAGQNWNAWHIQSFTTLTDNVAASFNGTPSQSGTGPSATLNLNGPLSSDKLTVYIVKKS